MFPWLILADIQTASEVLKSGISPLFSSMVTIAAILCVLVMVFGGYRYLTSAGRPEKLEQAKKILRNAFIGLILILGAGTVVAFMQNSYSEKAMQPNPITQISIESPPSNCTVCSVVNESISGFVNSVLRSVGQPIVEVLKQFTVSTPLMAQNSAVFNLWLVVVVITNTLFLLVIGLIGFRVMSSSVIGIEEVDLRSLLPQLIFTFILVNVSIFAIDAVITVSNVMTQALVVGMSADIFWTAIGTLLLSASAVNIGTLLFIAVAIILAVMLLIYLLKRIIVLYIGAVLSPLIIMLWLLPSFRDFAVSAAKMYIMTIFVLFTQVVVLMLAVSLFSGMVKGEENPFMTSLLVIATLLVLLSTNRVMNQLALMNSNNQGFRKLTNTFVSGASFVASSVKKEQGSRPSVYGVRTDGVSATRVHVPLRTTTSLPMSEGLRRSISKEEKK